MTKERGIFPAIAVSTIVGAGLCLLPTAVRADTLLGALALAYQNNPQLNSQRAILRQTDETVPQALSGYRPTVTATATAGEQFQDTLNKGVSPANPNQAVYTESHFNFAPRTVGVTATQTLYNGYRTANRTRQAESQVSAARETMRRPPT
jgi:outer membrane protein